jgi:Delta7-sterol 5-desaturase
VNTDSNIIMGAKFHTAHHVYYVCNHGQFFTFCDRIFGTFRMPPASYSRSKSS